MGIKGISDLRISLLFGRMTGSYTALSYNFSDKVYCAFTLQGTSSASLDEALPLITSPLNGITDSLWRSALLGLHYVFEIASGSCCLLTIHVFAGVSPLLKCFPADLEHIPWALMLLFALQFGLLLPSILRTCPCSEGVFFCCCRFILRGDPLGRFRCAGCLLLPALEGTGSELLVLN